MSSCPYEYLQVQAKQVPPVFFWTIPVVGV